MCCISDGRKSEIITAKRIVRKQSGEEENSRYEYIGAKDCGELDKFGADKEHEI
jgi:hypothetical protein